MKRFTPLLIVWIVGIVSQLNPLSAQNSPCDAFDATLTAKGVYCGSQRGAIEINIEGGKSGQYVIEWDNHDNSVWNKTNTFLDFYSIEDLRPGDYKIKIMDFFTKCAVTKSITLTNNATPEGLSLEGNAVQCNGMGTISVKIPNSHPPFNLSLKGPVTANYVANSRFFKIYNLPAGEYEVGFITDGCVATTYTTVSDGEGLPKLSVETVMGNCNISTGAVLANISGGEAGYTLSWDGPTEGSMELSESAVELAGFLSGVYKFILEDGNGCKSFSSLNIDRSGMSVALTSSDAICNQNGAIKVDITSGTAPYTVIWRGGDIDGEATREIEGNSTSLSVSSGTYIVEIRDANGCSTFANTIVSEKPTDLYCSITPRATTCNQDNGAINIFISGGTKPYSLSYEGPASGSLVVNGSTSFNDLPAGTYTTYLTDADGCSVSESSEVKVGPSEEANSSFTYSANGTSIFFYNNSSAGSYSWTFGDGSTSSSLSPNHDYSAAGAYEVCLTTTGKCDENTSCQTIQIIAFKEITGQSLQTGEGPNLGKNGVSKLTGGMNIAQNYPNPFVNQTDILFELPEAVLTTITIHDNTGRIVKKHTANYDKGQNLFTFNQNNLASGVYYYTITAGTLSATKKMLVD